MRDLKPEGTEVTVAYRPRPQFLPFHSRAGRFACIVTHRRAGKTVGSSHAADAFRYLAMALDHAVIRKGFLRPLAYPPSGLV